MNFACNLRSIVMFVNYLFSSPKFSPNNIVRKPKPRQAKARRYLFSFSLAIVALKEIPQAA